jgi:hypothetical protein
VRCVVFAFSGLVNVTFGSAPALPLTLTASDTGPDATPLQSLAAELLAAVQPVRASAAVARMTMGKVLRTSSLSVVDGFVIEEIDVHERSSVPHSPLSRLGVSRAARHETVTSAT